MTVGLVGSGPAASAVEAALGDVDARVEAVPADDLSGTHRLAVVVDRAGATTFERVNDRALAAGLPWIAVELGGVGGYPVVDAAVAGFGPDGACYRCLAKRVASNVAADADPVAPPSDPTARLAGSVAGNRAVQALAEDDPDVLGRLVELPHAERDLLPVPGCACGAGRDRTLAVGYRERSVDAALRAAERGLDGRVGIVTDVGEAESYPAPYYLAQVCDTAGFSDATAGRQAAGVDPGWDAAFMKALGEGLERYCAGVYRDEEFTSATTDPLDSPLPPSSFVRPDDWGGESADGETLDRAERPWVEGVRLGPGGRVQVPAELVHYPPPERTIRPAVTTGLGLGNSTTQACRSGLYEVVERDATTVAWYSTYEPLGLVVDEPGYRQLAARAGAEGLEATALLCTQDVDVPVVAVAVHRETWPKLAFGTAAHLDPADAARRALAEAVQNWVELREMGAEGASEASGAIGRYADRPPAVESFVDPDKRVPAASVGPETVPDGEAHLDALVERVRDADLDPVAVRTTTRDVERLGFEGVRVLVPGAQPLFFENPFFGDRARAVPADLGFEPALDRPHHPYP